MWCVLKVSPYNHCVFHPINSFLAVDLDGFRPSIFLLLYLQPIVCSAVQTKGFQFPPEINGLRHIEAFTWLPRRVEWMLDVVTLCTHTSCCST